MKTCLSIAGSDPSGGAGIQADIKTFSAHGCFGMSVITAVVAENTQRVISILNVDTQIIKDQIDAIFEDIDVHAVKVGMLANTEIMCTIREKLDEYMPVNIVIDPVMVAKGGQALMEREALCILKNKIIPYATILTPNIPEAEAITDIKIESIEDMKKAACVIFQMGAKNVLIKGGHLKDDPVDILYDGEKYFSYENKRINTKNTHGTGCTLSSAIAANLANGKSVETAVKNAKDYVTNAIKYNCEIGKGHGPTNHFYKWFK